MHEVEDAVGRQDNKVVEFVTKGDLRTGKRKISTKHSIFFRFQMR